MFHCHWVIKKHHLEPGEEEAHLHFRAWFSNLCRPLLICPSLPRPSALNANKPKTAGVQRPRIRIYKQFKRDISKDIYTNTINISQFITLPLLCTVKSSSGNNRCFSLIQLANWLWLFVKIALAGCEAAPPLPLLREKTSPQRLLMVYVQIKSAYLISLQCIAGTFNACVSLKSFHCQRNFS